MRCAIIDSSFASLMDVGNAHYFPLGYFAPRAMRTADWLNDAGVPVLVMHGKRDDVVPFKLGMIAAMEPARYYDTVTRFIAGASAGPRHP